MIVKTNVRKAGLHSLAAGTLDVGLGIKGKMGMYMQIGPHKNILPSGWSPPNSGAKRTQGVF